MRWLVLFALTLASCGGDSPSSDATRSPSASASVVVTSNPPTPPPVVAGDYCEDLPKIGSVLKSVSKGTKLPDDITTALGAYQQSVGAQAAAATAHTVKKALAKVADALGQLSLAIADAGTDYPYDSIVDLRRQSASITLLTAALASACPT